MSIPEVNAFYIGALIALYERAVGFYGSLVRINAYDQPGVEAGKKAASKLLQLQKRVRKELSGEGKTAEEIAPLSRCRSGGRFSLVTASGEQRCTDQGRGRR